MLVAMVRGPFVALIAATIAGGCFGRAGAYACDEDADCNAANGGRCEATGFCSYLDTSCDSGRRYDALAPVALDGECVSPADETSGTTGVGPCSDCTDLDGDGYGVGSACMGMDCDDANPTRHTGCLYVGPDGNDMNTGDDPSAPWGTLARAVGALVPGDSLVLLPGSYEVETTGLLRADCGVDGNAVAGTMSLPISIRGGRNPMEERQAILESDGSRPAIYLAHCHHWKLSGLTGLSQDLAGGAGSVVELRTSNSVSAHNLLVAHSNRLVQSFGVYVTSDDALLEDLEVYDFHITGIHVGTSNRATVRRAYVNSREGEDPPDTPYPTYHSTTGDHGLRFASGAGHKVENSVFTDLGLAIVSEADVDIVGTVAFDVVNGLFATGGRVVVHDAIVVNSQNNSIDFRSVTMARIDGATIIGGGSDGVYLGPDSELACDPKQGCTSTVLNVLSLRNEGIGIGGVSPVDWSVAGSNANGNAMDYRSDDAIIDDDDGRIQRSLSDPAEGIGLERGKCVVFIPENSAMHGRGEDGADIGANILTRTVDGELTEIPLWDPKTGAFPCGNFVPGINDRPGASCFDFHSLLNVRTNECELPPATPSCDGPI